MQYRPRGGPDLDRGHPLILGQGDLDDEVAIDVRTGGADLVGLLHADHQVRFAKLPPIEEIGQLRQAQGITLLHAGLDPPREQLDITISKPPGITEISMPRNRMPGRHVTAPCDPGNHAATLLYVTVAQQIEGGDLAGAVAAGAIVEDDGSYVLGEGHLLRKGLLRCGLIGLAARTPAEREPERNGGNEYVSDIHPGHLQYVYCGLQ